jgi:hypothetical protein
MNTLNQTRIQLVSRRFRLLLTIIILLTPIATLLSWTFFNSLPTGFKSGLPVRVTEELSSMTLVLGFLITLVPMSVELYGALHLKRLFALYEQGIVFAEANITCFRHIGYALIGWVPTNMVYIMLMSLNINYAKPFGKRVIFQIGTSDMVILFFGGVVLLISWVMKEAGRLEDEMAHTV